MSDYLGANNPERDDTDIEETRRAFDKVVQGQPKSADEALDQLQRHRDRILDFCLVSAVISVSSALAGYWKVWFCGLFCFIGLYGVCCGISFARMTLYPFLHHKYRRE